jgi:tetratricopeptide (TPR) repeat protein
VANHPSPEPSAPEASLPEKIEPPREPEPEAERAVPAEDDPDSPALPPPVVEGRENLVEPEPEVEAAEPFDDGAFAAAMTEALAAMERQDYGAAREAFARAQAARPGAPEAASGLAQAEEALKSLAIASHRDRATELERAESWRAAEAEYDAALALDPSLRFAREGKERSAACAILQEKLEFQIAHPERLSDPGALEEAASLVEEAREADHEGPRRREAVEKLAALVSTYALPMELSIVSDALTDVTLHRVGRLGKFERKVLEVRPGRYVAVGSRDGFRDVRVEFTVEPGKPLPPIQVRCEEAI